MYRLGVSIAVGFIVAILLNLATTQPAAAIDCGRNRSHNLILGRRRPHDIMLSLGYPKVWKKSAWVTSEVNATYPSAYDRRGNITYIEIVDNFKNYTGGCPFVVKGGINAKNVTLRFISQRGQGLDFVYKIYGLPTW